MLSHDFLFRFWGGSTSFGKTRICTQLIKYAFLHDTMLHNLCTSCLITVWFWSQPLLGMKRNTNTDCATWRGQTQYGLAPACCSSSDGVGIGAGILGSTLWLPLRWIAWDLGVFGRAASACSPALECCHIWPVHLTHQCTCRNKQSQILTIASAKLINLINVHYYCSSWPMSCDYKSINVLCFFFSLHAVKVSGVQFCFYVPEMNKKSYRFGGEWMIT